MRVFRDFMRFYIVPVVLLIGAVLTAVFTVYYTCTVQTQTGETISSTWPRTFTQEFSKYLICEDGMPALTDTGKAQLDDNGLWLQVLDISGAEVIRYGTPEETPVSYEPYELLQLYQSGSGEYSVFLGKAEFGGCSYPYLIGFPLSISKVITYVDTARYNSGKSLILAVIVLTAALVITLTVFSYKTFRSAEHRREQDTRAKEEWLANITHDLKTPLAPIRGYGELLSEEGELTEETIRRYGSIILKNALYTEQLVDDLKLTYQLQSNMLPLKAETQNITRFAREVMIDILNVPDYEKRSIDFHADKEELLWSFDAQLLRRALANVVINALKHNTADTEITVSIDGSSGVRITVADNGIGIPLQELEGLFKRYYRGTSTEVKAEGSGLGMAIAKQIVEAHGGKISAQSEVGAGTMIIMQFPR